ncbi:MAG: translation initiation factor IF-3 [bacterium]|nr:translation initiation factor IF-3 [bacterium]
MRRTKAKQSQVISARINETIRCRELRVIDEEEGNLGIMKTEDALAKARERGVDLIEVSPNAEPPIAKIGDYGKWLYEQKKKKRESKASTSTETKSVQVKIATGDHDLELKAKRASAFLKEGHRVKIELFLRGRSKYLGKDFHSERLDRILRLISEPYKIASSLAKSHKGVSLIIERDKSKKKVDIKPETAKDKPKIEVTDEAKDHGDQNK